VEYVRTSDDSGCAGIDHLPRIFAAQPTVYLDHRIETALVTQAP